MPRRDPRELAAIFTGGVLGAVLRVWVTRHLVTADDQWPWAVFLINISGSIVLAYAVTRLQQRPAPSTYRRAFVATGFCGAFTTFSTMELELLTMLDGRRYGLAVGYAVASVAGGYLAVWMTTALTRRRRALT